MKSPRPAAPAPAAGAFRSSRALRLLLPAVFAVLLAACSQKPAETKAAGAARKQVGIVTLQSERLAIRTELPGRTGATLVAEIRPQIGGIVQKRLYTEGALVKAGEPLYQIDPAPAEAAWRSAQAASRKAAATVAAARVTAARNAELVKIDAVSKQVNDDAQAALAQAEADLAVARAAEETARINLGYTRIVSPIAGRAGLSTVTPGALVTAGQTTALTTVQQLDPIHVDVTQSSAELLRLKRELASGRLQRAGADGARIGLVLEDGSAYPLEGKLVFSGVTVDPATGAVTLRASVPNPDGLLMPGMYVRAVLQEGVDADGLLVPQQAVTRNAAGEASVLAVGEGNRIERRKLTVDRAIGSRWQVTSGLKAGDRVVIEGSQRVKVGDVVETVAVAPVGESPGGASGAAAALGSTAPAAGGTAPAAAAR